MYLYTGQPYSGYIYPTSIVTGYNHWTRMVECKFQVNRMLDNNYRSVLYLVISNFSLCTYRAYYSGTYDKLQ